MKKKLFSTLSAAVMLSALLAGCSSNEAEKTGEPTDATTETPTQETTDGEKETLKVAVFEGGYGKAFWEEVVKRFEADYPNVTVELTASPKIGE